MQTRPKVCFLLASRIASCNRLMFARQSLESLGNAMGRPYRLIVVHDSRSRPRFVPQVFFGSLPTEKADAAGLDLYSGADTTLLRRFGRGSASALQIAVDHAIREGFEFGYIHMDDHVYAPCLPQLLEHGVEELSSSPELAWLRFSGYPIISSQGREFIRLGDAVRFDSVNLERHVRKGYTCWSSPVGVRSSEGRYWPVAMWHALYRLDILRDLLARTIECNKSVHLAGVEEYYKNGAGMGWLEAAFGAIKFGYINMQFAGFEMHRNPEYQGLLDGPNAPEL